MLINNDIVEIWVVIVGIFGGNSLWLCIKLHYLWSLVRISALRAIFENHLRSGHKNRTIVSLDCRIGI